MGRWRKVRGGLAVMLLAAVAVACGRHRAPRSGAGRVVQSFQTTGSQVGGAVGEGASGNATSILRTTDGGARWAQVFGATRITAMDFLDNTHAWVLGQRGSSVRMERTSDGGATWQGGAVPPNPASGVVETASLDFITAAEGWAVLCGADTPGWTAQARGARSGRRRQSHCGRGSALGWTSAS